jgi:Lysozyme like domain
VSILTAGQIYQLALSVGFPASTAVQMTAIALKESAGNTNAYNGVPPDDSYGLWQINMYGNLGPARMAQFGLNAETDLFDPTTNAAAAYTIWGGNDNNLNIAWAINGADAAKYQQALPIAQAAAAQLGYGGATGGGGVTLTPGANLPATYFSLPASVSAGLDWPTIVALWNSLGPLPQLGVGAVGLLLLVNLLD